MFKMISVGIVLNVLINIPHYYIPILLLHPNEKKTNGWTNHFAVENSGATIVMSTPDS